MKVNGWGYEPRDPAGRVVCKWCTATLEFGEDDITTVRIGDAEFRSIRCPRCRSRHPIPRSEPCT